MVLRSRTGVDITVRFPDVAMTLAVLYRTGTRVLDGEIVVFDTDGRPDFELVMKRFAQHSAFRANRLAPAAPATFVAFDMLFRDGEDLRALPLFERQARLARDRVDIIDASDHVMVIDSSDDGPAMWSFMVRDHLEGLVAKLHTSPYRAGRDAAWVKIKRVRRATVLITGWEIGCGSRLTGVGAMVMSLSAPRWFPGGGWPGGLGPARC